MYHASIDHNVPRWTIGARPTHDVSYFARYRTFEQVVAKDT